MSDYPSHNLSFSLCLFPFLSLALSLCAWRPEESDSVCVPSSVPFPPLSCHLLCECVTDSHRDVAWRGTAGCCLLDRHDIPDMAALPASRRDASLLRPVRASFGHLPASTTLPGLVSPLLTVSDTQHGVVTLSLADVTLICQLVATCNVCCAGVGQLDAVSSLCPFIHPCLSATQQQTTSAD